MIAATPRAVRRLALTEQYPTKAKLLHQIADEYDHGLLVTAEWMTPAKFIRKPREQLELTDLISIK